MNADKTHRDALPALRPSVEKSLDAADKSVCATTLDQALSIVFYLRSSAFIGGWESCTAS